MTTQDKIQAAISLTESWQSNAALNKERARETGDDAVFDNAQKHLDVYETILEALRVYAVIVTMQEEMGDEGIAEIVRQAQAGE